MLVLILDDTKDNHMLWQIILAALGVVENLVPVFVHNPQSQKVEAIVVTSVNHAIETLAPTLNSTPASTPPK